MYYCLSVLALSLVMNLLITWFFELVVALTWGLRTWRALFIVALVNAATNPPVSALMVFLSFTTLGRSSLWLLLILEPLIVLIEGWIYQRALPQLAHPYLFSLVANLASAVLGMLI